MLPTTLQKLVFVIAFMLSAPFATVEAQERPLTLRVVQSGHSLTDGIMEPLRFLVRSEGVRQVQIDQSTAPGSTMDWRWNNADPNKQTDARYDIDKYDVMVLTERVPLSGTRPWHNSDSQALQWFKHAWTEGNGGQGAETILYATWVNVDSGPTWANGHKDPDSQFTYRQRMPLEMANWKEIQAYVNANRPVGSPPMRMIPGPILMATIYDEIEGGRAPGLSDISDLFVDQIHLNEMGSYFIALAHFAVIYNRDPRGVQNSGAVTPEQALWMQDLVWRVLSEEGVLGGV
ncbi:MAG: hypothetical protein AAF801_01315 [Pseudomonadota bacterium]